MNRRQKLVQQQFLNNERAVISRLQYIYDQSLVEINRKIHGLEFKIDDLTEVYDWMDDDDPEKEKIRSMIRSKVYQKQYQEQIQGQLEGILKQMQTKQYLTVSDYLNECYEDGFVGALFDQHGQGVPLMMPLNQEAMVNAVQLESKISQGLYTRLGEDVATLKKRIAAEVTRGIAIGAGWKETAQQLAGQTRIGYNRAVRITRTEGHRIQNTATMNAAYDAKERGADLLKQWDATLDGKTRESHVAVDGEIRELDESFSNGLDYPGDPAGGAAEVVNCRCAMLQRARWAVEGSFTKWNNFTKQLETFDGPESYDEFKKAFFSDENKQYMNYVQQMEKKYGTKDFTEILDMMNEREYKHYSKLFANNPVYNDDIKIAKMKDAIKSAKPNFMWPEANDDTAAVERRWAELHQKYHAEVVDVRDTLLTKQEEYDVLFSNRVEQLMKENPKIKRSTAERKTKELLGERPDKNSLAFLGGDFNMITHTMTLNTQCSLLSGTFEHDIERRARRFARAERRGTPAMLGNVSGDSLEGVFIHEYGHAIDAKYGISSNPKFLDYYHGFTEDEISVGLSEYGATNAQEFIAECFAESAFEDQRTISKGFMKILEEIINDPT